MTGHASLFRKLISSCSALAIAVAVGLSAHVAAAQGALETAVRSFNIPSQPLNQALLTFAEQSETAVVVPRELTKDRQAPAVRGSMAPRDALDLLLKDSGLKYSLDEQGSITIAQASADTALNDGDSRIRLAQATSNDTTPTAEMQSGGTMQPLVVDNLVITATRRAKNLRDVPSNISVLTGGGLEDLAAGGFEDYLKLVPGVQFNDTGLNQNANITIRGISTSTGTGITQQTVGIYIDETPFSDVFSFLSSPDLTPFDLDRVEILRGPQGALYGSGSMGGAIRYVTAKPVLGEFAAKYNGALSHTNDGGLNHLNQAMINIPLGDTFAVRGVVSYRRDNGYVDNLLTGEDDYDDVSQLHGRFLARWTPTDRLNIILSYLYQDAENDGLSSIQDNTGETPTEATRPFSFIELEYQIANLTAEYDFGFADFLLSTSYAAKDRQADFDQGPTATLATLAAFDGFLSFAIPGFVPGTVTGSGVDQNFLFSQPESDGYFVEARLLSKTDQRFRWMMGGLYTRIDNFNPIQQFIPGLNDVLTPIAFPAPFDMIFGAPNAAAFFGVPPSDQLLDFFQQSKAREYAVYGEVEFDITDQIEITAGGRYFDYTVETQLGLAGAVLADIDNDISDFMPRITLSYQATDDVLLYAVASRGYRVGGVNDTIVLSLAPGESLEDSVAPLTYDTDNLWNYEIGVKSEWYDGALIADVGVYYVDWSEIQLSSFFDAPLSPSGGVAAISNVGSASVIGVEAQFIAEPNEHIRFTSSVSWNDAELDEASPIVPNIETGGLVFAQEGSQLPGSRQWQTSNAVTISGDVLQLPTSFTLSHQFASSTINDFVIQERLPSYNLIDMQLNVDLPRNVRVGAFVRNLFDEREIVTFTPANPATITPRAFTFNRPRTVGITLSAAL